MDQLTFHPFPRLPPELRRHIFLLTIEPRFVLIRSKSLVELTEEDKENGLSHFDAFANRVAPWNLTVDPRMAHFARDWRHLFRLQPPFWSRASWNFHPRYPYCAIQTQLTDFGFTTTKSCRLPWTPTAECPDIQPHHLYDDTRTAWKMARPYWLSSNAPVPPLLHTCFESRQVLIQRGYQLAFGTRAAAPRTWFCFRHDVLYLTRVNHKWTRHVPIHRRDCESQEDSELGVWDLDPRDLTRVRRLALDSITFDEFPETLSTVQACQNLAELFTVEHRLDGAMLRLMAGEWGDRGRRCHSDDVIAAKESPESSFELRDEVDALWKQVCSDKHIQRPLDGVAFDCIVWENTEQPGDWKK